MLTKTLYRVKGKKINIMDESGHAKTFLKGEEFETYPQCVPTGFLDLVDVLGPAEIKREVDEVAFDGKFPKPFQKDNKEFEEEVPLKRTFRKPKDEFIRTARQK